MNTTIEKTGFSALKFGFGNGIKKGFATYWWIMKILSPIAVTIGFAQHFGWLARLDFLLRPVMSILSLPPEAALPLLIGIMIGPSGCIGAMTVIPFTMEQMTVMSVFCLIAHAMVVECTIQGQSGYSTLKSWILRLSCAVILAFITSMLIDSTTSIIGSINDVGKNTSFQAFLINMGCDLFSLAVKLFLLIMTFACLLEIFKTMNWIDPVVKALSPLLKLMGLSPRVGIIWVTAALFGLIYGAAIIKEESRSGNLRQDELNSFHASIAVNHGLFNEPVLFLSLGVHPVFLWLPRLLMAMLLARIFSIFKTDKG